jgi:hypothetical protein
MWIVWIKTRTPYIWDSTSYFRLDVGEMPVNKTGSLCGKNPEGLSTSYPQENALSQQFHILDSARTTAHIWGYQFTDIFGLLGNSPQSKPFIHRLSRLIHILGLQIRVMRDSPAP